MIRQVDLRTLAIFTEIAFHLLLVGPQGALGFQSTIPTTTLISQFHSSTTKSTSSISSCFVSLNIAEGITEESISSTATAEFNLIDLIVHNPTFWSFNVMLVIVGLLYTWDKFVEYAKEETPAPIVPVIESILQEMGGLGFIGLFLSVVLNQAAFGEVVGNISEQFLGEKDILLESFEFFHEAFFQAAMAFFATAAFIIVRVLGSFQAILDLSVDGETTSKALDEVSSTLAGILDAPTIEKATRIGRFLEEGSSEAIIPMDSIISKECNREEGGNPLRRELLLTPKERGAEILVIRERLKREFDLPDDFEIRKYLENVFASNNLDLVEFSPLSWLPLIPAIALAQTVDMDHEVVIPSAANAFETSGYFLSTKFFFLPKLLIEAFSLGWGVHNFWKISSIKAMLIPTVVRLEGEEGAGRLLRPSIESTELRQEFQARSTPFWAKPIEKFYGKPPTNRVEELFGVAGGNGLALYLNSIKFHTWFLVSSLIVFSSIILPRDLYALTHMDTITVGNPDKLIPELVVFGLFALSNIAQLALQPIVFLNYCLISCVEENVNSEALNFAESIASRETAPASATEA